MKVPCFLLSATLAATSGRTAGLDQTNAVERPMIRSAIQLPIEGDMPSLGGARAWLNSRPLTLGELRGKVVLIEFWTYTCINWRRTLPYVRSWAEKYKDHGLVVIGVHTPEFGFEKDVANVDRATSELRVPYPVAVDSDYVIWGAFRNQYWPAIYIADAREQIRYHQFGEGDYEQTERVIQQLLAESGHSDVPRELVSLDPQGAEAAADWANLGSAETYVGYNKAEHFAFAHGAARGRAYYYTVPAKLTLNEWALAGEWTVAADAAALNGESGRLVYRFHARDLNLIMGPAVPGARVRYHVRIDGGAPGKAHGADVDAQGEGTVTEPRMYQLIRQPDSMTDHLFEIEFVGPGVEVFDFTFG